MENKCLITKLKAVVSDSTLEYLGGMYINVSKNTNLQSLKNRGFGIIVNTPTLLKSEGNIYFSDESLTENKGTQLEIPANKITYVYVSDDNGRIFINNKYALVRISPIYGSTATPILQSDLEYLKYSTNLQFLYTATVRFSGDIKNLENLVNLSYLYGSYGDLLYGNLKYLSKLTKLTTLVLDSTTIQGDIQILKNFQELTYLMLVSNTKNALSGDVSLLPKKVNVFKSTSIQLFTWDTERSSNCPIITFSKVNFGKDVDKVLINSAKCNISDASSKTIVIYGTRTSASDEAVATLQSKGYTVSVEPVS